MFLFDAEQHNPRMHMELFDDNPQMQEFVRSASHGQVMLSMFRETFPALPEGTARRWTSRRWRFRFPTSGGL